MFDGSRTRNDRTGAGQIAGGLIAEPAITNVSISAHGSRRPTVRILTHSLRQLECADIRTRSYRVRSGADLGRVVRDTRTEHRLTQQQVIDEFGLSFDRTRLARIESGEGLQSLDRALSVLRRLGVDVVALWPGLRTTSAMSVNGTFEPTSLHDFVAEAHRWGVGTTTAERVLAALVADLREAVITCTHEAVAALVDSRLDLLESH